MSLKLAVYASYSHKLLISASLLIAAVATPAFAQGECPLGPRCQAVNDKAMSYVNNAQSRLKGQFIAAGAAAASYCTMRIAAEANRVCGTEWQARGLSQCAALADAQTAEFLSKAEEAKQASQAMSNANGSWSGNCGW